MPPIEEFQQAKLAAKERAQQIGREAKNRIEADSSLSQSNRYLTYVELAELFGRLARKEGRLV